ncbi:tyrosine-protein phosphatase Lar [Trichonephila clavipes]|nr:tyrosine-protein phosphatase Lar [Trichonephila clavipes]
MSNPTILFFSDPPRIETFPRNQTVQNNGVASFVCTAVGNPKPVIEWRKNGKRVSTQRYIIQDMPSGSVLRIDPVKAGRDDATYECVAENGFGEPVRAIATLTVLTGETSKFNSQNLIE